MQKHRTILTTIATLFLLTIFSLPNITIVSAYVADPGPDEEIVWPPKTPIPPKTPNTPKAPNIPNVPNVPNVPPATPPPAQPPSNNNNSSGGTNSQPPTSKPPGTNTTTPPIIVKPKPPEPPTPPKPPDPPKPPKPPVNTREALSLTADKDFKKTNLTSEEQMWYDRMWAAIHNPDQYPNADKAANSGDLYAYSRTLNSHINALLIAFRATGDVNFLDEADRLMQITRSKLADTNNDGFLNWRWMRIGEEDSGYWGKDTHSMDEMLTHAMVAQFAYALYENQDLNPKYKQHAAFWTNYLENQFLKKWEQRGGIDKSLTHPYAHFTKFYYYMYKLTNNKSYLNQALERAKKIDSMMVPVQTPNGTAFVWDHRVPGMGEESLGCQPNIYATLSLEAFIDMSLEKFGKYANDSYMQNFARTISNIVLVNGAGNIPSDICGGSINLPDSSIENTTITDDTYDYNKLSIWGGIIGMAAWDDSGKIQKEMVITHNKIEADKDDPRRIFTSAYMLLQLTKLSSSD